MNQKNLTQSLKYEIPDDLETRYAEQSMVSASSEELNLLFFQFIPPMDEQLNAGEKIRARCFIRIILSPAHLERLRTTIDEQLRLCNQSSAPPQSGGVVQ